MPRPPRCRSSPVPAATRRRRRRRRARVALRHRNSCSVPCVPRPRWGAILRVPAAAARSSRTATACSKESNSLSVKPRLRVVAAALFDSLGRVLIAERPAGKHMAGWWEFPGGKVGQGEVDAEALVRELREELGVDSCADAPIMTLTHDYPDRVVELVLWRATIIS